MSVQILKLFVSAEFEGERLDIFCARKVTDRTRSYFTKLASAGHVSVDGSPAKPSLKVKQGMRVNVELIDPPPLEAHPEDIPLNIVYEDNRIIVVDKSYGMVVHPAAGNYDGTLVNALMHHLKESKSKNFDKTRLGLVHRLDKDTSGLLVVAKDESALVFLQEEMRDRRIRRLYKALVWGKVSPAENTIDLPIGRSERDRKKMAVFQRQGRTAVTEYKLLESYEYASLLDVKLQTGRTHQIRVHLSYIGYPIVGDPTYRGRSSYLKRFGRNEKNKLAPVLGILNRQALHAYSLEFPHPDNGDYIRFESALPQDFVAAVDFFKNLI